MMKKLTVELLALCVAVSVEAQSDIRHSEKRQTGELDSGISLQEVVVTGTGTQHLLKNAPVQTEVIGRRQLEQFAGRSLEEILSGLTASFAFNEGDMGSQLQMNGLGNNYILIMVNGKRLHGDNGGENDLGLIDPQNIERIEIVKGASSALYGSDAIAGVINIITKKHDDALLLENSIRSGSYGNTQLHSSIGLGVGKLKSYTNFHKQGCDGWQNTATEDRRQTEFLITDSRNKTVNEYRNWQLSERLTYEPVKGLEFYAEGMTYRKRIYRPHGKYPGVDIKTYDLAYQNESAAAGASWKINRTDVLTLDVDWNRHVYNYEYTAFTLTDGYEPNGSFTPYYPYFSGDTETQSDQRRTMAQMKGVFTLPAIGQLSVGAEWRYDLLKAPMRVEGGRADDHTEAVYLQDEWSHPLAGDDVSLFLTGGLRLNHNGQFGYRFTPKLSAMLSLGDNWRLRATWSQGFKTPTPKEQHYRYIRNMSGTYLYLGNIDLKPQSSNYYSLGGEWNNGGLNITVTGYLNKVDDMITLVTIPNQQAPAEYILQYDPRKTRQYHNLESAKTKGVDLSVRYQINSEWMIGLAYSYLDTDAWLYNTEDERLERVVIDGTAHHKGSWNVTWNKRLSDSYKMGFGLYGRMSSKRYYQLNGDGKGYQIWKLSTSHDITSEKESLLRIEAGIDNIFNYFDDTPHGLHLGTTTPGRTVYATLSIRFNRGKKLKFTSNNNTLKQQNNEEN